MEPRTLFERQDVVASGSRIGIRAATFFVGGRPHGGVTISLLVPPEFGVVNPDGSVSATLLLNPDEGLAVAGWLREAFHAADPAGPPLYEHEGSPDT